MDTEIISSLYRVIPFAIVIIIFCVLLQRNKINRDMIALRAPHSWLRFLMWWLGFLVLVLAIEFILSGLGLLEVTPWTHPSIFATIIRITGAVAFAPIAEELLFRGMILYKFSKRMNKHLVIALQACLFVLLHSFTYQNTFTSNFSIFQGLLDASLFAYARYSTNSLYTSIAMHATGNLVAVLERFVL